VKTLTVYIFGIVSRYYRKECETGEGMCRLQGREKAYKIMVKKHE